MYNWPGMRKIPWEEVKELIRSNQLTGCFRLYDDGTEGMIEDSWDLDDIYDHYNRGGEFGEEIGRFKTTEMCPHCENEVEIESVGVQICPKCHKSILPCSACELKCCNECGYQEDELYKVGNDKKENAAYWDSIEDLATQYLKKLSQLSYLSDVREPLEDHILDITKKVTEVAVKELEAIGGVFPFVDEDL